MLKKPVKVKRNLL